MPDSLHLDGRIHSRKQPSEPLYSKGGERDFSQLRPKAQRGQIEDVDGMIDIAGAVDYGEVLPLVEVYVGAVGRVGDVEQLAALPDHEIGYFSEDWSFVAVEEGSWVGQIVEGEIAHDELVQLAWVLAPGVHGLGGEHHSIQHHAVDDRLEANECEEEEAEEECDADATADHSFLDGHIMEIIIDWDWKCRQG